MQTDDPIKIDQLFAHPATLKILLGLLGVEYAYQFQLTRMTGVHSRGQKRALEMLIRMKLVRTVQPKIHVKNVGQFFALTERGVQAATILRAFATSLENSK